MKLTRGASILAIRDLFSVHSPQGVGPIDAHTLYLLWKSTGLRRSDLNSGLAAMMESGSMLAACRDQDCQYSLTRSDHGARIKPKVLFKPALDHSAAAPSGGESDVDLLKSAIAFGRRRQDHSATEQSKDRRRTLQSRLLKALPGQEREEVEQMLELVPMPAGLELWKKGDVAQHFYFPIDSVVSLLQEAQGCNVQLATIGNEGMVDAEILFGDGVARTRASVEISGFAFRAPVHDLREVFSARPSVRSELDPCRHALVSQEAILADCNASHPLRNRLPRLLLSILDRTRSIRIKTSQLRMSVLLGVSPSDFAQEVERLNSKGVVGLERGAIVVLDRHRLEQNACECYSAIRDRYNLLRRSVRADRGITSLATGLAGQAHQQ